jgi:hypothetical protein
MLLPGIVLAEAVDIEFQSSGSKKYHTTSLSDDLRRHYGIESTDEKVLLVETPYLSSPQYEAQRDQLSIFGHKAEEYQIMFVVACQNEEYKHGYHTTIADARKLSNGQSLFRVRLMDSKGVVLNESNQPVLEKVLVEWLEN